MSGGYIKLYRSILDWSLFKEEGCVLLLVFCQLNASYTENAYHGLTLKPGQFLMSNREMADRLGWGVNRVRRGLKLL